jgi:hypothetical protein
MGPGMRRAPAVSIRKETVIAHALRDLLHVTRIGAWLPAAQ